MLWTKGNPPTGYEEVAAEAHGTRLHLHIKNSDVDLHPETLEFLKFANEHFGGKHPNAHTEAYAIWITPNGIKTIEYGPYSIDISFRVPEQGYRSTFQQIEEWGFSWKRQNWGVSWPGQENQ
jgi:hypothetical protein